MKAANLYLSLSVLSAVTVLVNPFDSVTLGVLGGIGFLTGGIYSYFTKERCNSQWIAFNPRGLKTDLTNKLFGQHIASSSIFKAVSGFMSSPNSQKPLVLSLHGTTGTGKNFVSKIIAKNIYRKGMDSKFVHIFTATKHFPHSSQIAVYKSWLQSYIEEHVTNCEQSLFIFDEMSKMHPGLIDVIMPYLDYYDLLDRVSYRKSIFIFLSNAGGQSITEKALDFWRARRIRESIELKDLENLVSLSVFNNEKSGFFQTPLIEKNLIDYFIPFLPLERRHIIQCVLAEMTARNHPPNQNVAEKLANDLVNYPKTESVFSAVGCKTIEKKLPFYL